jgi:hypothetical protein
LRSTLNDWLSAGIAITPAAVTGNPPRLKTSNFPSPSPLAGLPPLS